MTDVKKPAWWNDKIAASWTVAKNLAMKEWKKVAADSKQMKDEVMESALAFGHGARKTFTKFGAWTDEVERGLGEEWGRMTNDASASWEKVREAVKAEWERATTKPPGAGGSGNPSDSNDPHGSG
jgi:hypothetical protein